MKAGLTHCAMFFSVLFAVLCGCTGLDSYSSWNSKGIRFLMKNDHDRAIRAFTSAIEQAPENAESYYYRGYALLDAHCCSAALQDAKTSARYSDTCSARLLSGVAAFFTGDVKHANEEFSRMSQINPAFPEGIYMEGLCNLYLAADYPEAEKLFAETLGMDSDNSNFQAAYSRALFCSGEEEACKKYLTGLFKEDPEDLTILMELLAAKLYGNVPGEADIDKAVESLNHIFTASPLKLQLLARANALRNRYPEAVELQEKAIKNTLELNDLFLDGYLANLMETLLSYKQGVLPSGCAEQSKRLFYMNGKYPISMNYRPGN